MQYEIGLNNGLAITTEISDFDSEKRAVAMSEESLLAVTIGQYSASKHSVMYIAPVGETGDAEILLSTGKSFYVEDAEYNSYDYTGKVNSGQLFVALGNAVINRNFYMMAMPVEEER
ncbi:hypothetical protein ABZ756_06900 [Mammaliicoccus sciuri]